MSVSEFCSAVLIVQTLVVCLISAHVKVKRPIRIFPHLHCRLKYYNLSKQVFTLKKVKSSAICLRKSKDEIKKKVCLWNNFAPSVTYIWPHLFGTIRYCTVNYIILLGQLYSLTWQWLAVCSHCLLGKGKKPSNYCAVLESACQQQNSDLWDTSRASGKINLVRSLW